MANLVSVKKRNDFKKAYSKGKSFVAKSLVIYASKNYKKGLRIGITTSKKIGNAPQRNRARRIIRESARNVLSNFSGNFDIIFVARKSTVDMKSTQLDKTIEQGLIELILKKSNKGSYNEKGKSDNKVN